MTTRKLFIGCAAVALLIAGGQKSFAKYEAEQLTLETQLQQRIEGILAKTLPAKSYLVTVKVEMGDQPQASTVRNKTGGTEPNNPFLDKNRFVLPGVPQKKEFIEPTAPGANETVVNAFGAETLVRRIFISILVATDVPQEQIRTLRDIITGSIPFNPLRGDELDIENSPLLNQTSGVNKGAADDHFTKRSGGTMSNITYLILAIAMAGTIVFFLVFLFGPVRNFLNRLVAVLPRMGEQAAYAISNAPLKSGATPGSPQAGQQAVTGRNYRANGNGHEPENGIEVPFHFIREDQVAKLPILFRQMSPTQCALVLAYLPPEWASQVLAAMDTTAQTSIMKELSQGHEVPAETVQAVEKHVRAKLPFLVGGVDWIQSVYQLTQPQTQRALLATLNQQSPELAQTLRRKSFFFEDLGIINAGALRLVVQEIGFPAVALCLVDEKPEVRETLLRKLPVAMREIILQELELAPNDKVAIADAKARVAALGRRLMQDGRISLPERRIA